MTIPLIKEECIVAVLEKIIADSEGAVDWTRKKAKPMAEEQPFLMQLIIQTIERIHEVTGGGESVSQEVAYMQAVHAAMLTYQCVKATIEAEQLEQAYGE
jgi:hypothetical protein